jgi:hypothetical protein
MADDDIERLIDHLDKQGELLCEHLAMGNCPASIDGYCIGGTVDGHCHG